MLKNSAYLGMLCVFITAATSVAMTPDEQKEHDILFACPVIHVNKERNTAIKAFIFWTNELKNLTKEKVISDFAERQLYPSEKVLDQQYNMRLANTLQVVASLLHHPEVKKLSEYQQFTQLNITTHIEQCETYKEHKDFPLRKNNIEKTEYYFAEYWSWERIKERLAEHNLSAKQCMEKF